MKILKAFTLIHNNSKALLGKKKDSTKEYNGFKTTISKGLNIEETARIKTYEQSGVYPLVMEKIGEVLFNFIGKKEEHETHFFKSSKYNGRAKETKEFTSKWFNVDEIPYQELLEENRFWLPMMLQNHHFQGRISLDNNHKIKDYKLEQVMKK